MESLTRSSECLDSNSKTNANLGLIQDTSPQLQSSQNNNELNDHCNQSLIQDDINLFVDMNKLRQNFEQERALIVSLEGTDSLSIKIPQEDFNQVQEM